MVLFERMTNCLMTTRKAEGLHRPAATTPPGVAEDHVDGDTVADFSTVLVVTV